MPSDLLDEVNITRFTKAQGEEIRTFLLSDFHKTEPLNATLEVPPQDVLEFYKKLAGWCEEDISYVARDKGGSIVGIGLACFLDRLSGDNTSLNEPTERYSDKVEKIRCFINTLEDKRSSDLGPLPSSVSRLLYWVFVSVRSDRRRRGIAHRLLMHNLPVAKELGCEGAVAESYRLGVPKAEPKRVQQVRKINRCPVIILAKLLFEKLGYEHLMELSHAEWKDEDGQRVFSCKDGTKKAVLYYKRF
ncbi:acetyltransferase [Aphelenchoides avenae]|nr:acetyltransferase [Aphelenchus avenae]